MNSLKKKCFLQKVKKELGRRCRNCTTHNVFVSSRVSYYTKGTFWRLSEECPKMLFHTKKKKNGEKRKRKEKGEKQTKSEKVKSSLNCLLIFSLLPLLSFFFKEKNISRNNAHNWFVFWTGNVIKDAIHLLLGCCWWKTRGKKACSSSTIFFSPCTTLNPPSRKKGILYNSNSQRYNFFQEKLRGQVVLYSQHV